MHKTTLLRALLLGLMALALAACGDDNKTNDQSQNNGDTNNGDTNNGDTNNGTENNGENNGDENNGDVIDMRDCDALDLTRRPVARAEMMGVYDSRRQRIVFFGGDEGVPVNCSAAPRPVGGLWVYDNLCEGFQEIPFTEGPGPRARGVAAYDAMEDRMIVFGGRYREGASGNYQLYNEVWGLDLEGMTWELLHNGIGTAPSARVNTAAVYHPTYHEVMIFGGNTSNNGAFFEPQNDLWIFNLAEKSWRSLRTSGDVPSRRLFHTAALDPDNNKLYVYSGGDENAFFGPFLGDLYALDLQTLTWELLHDGGGNAPAPRIWANLTFNKLNGKIYLFGGHDDGLVGNQNDTWSFNLQTRQWEEIVPPEIQQNAPLGRCDFPPDFTEPNLDAPDRREAQLAVYDDNRGEWFVFGGKTDCGIIDDIWTFDMQREAWIQVSPATIGESCVRGDNPEQCVALCN